MFLLTKAFQLRDKANKNIAEKPFLEHLEDLRTTITRIVIVLLITTIACYSLKDILMDLLRRPLEVVWEQSQQERLPENVSPDLWEHAKSASHYSSGLSQEAKTVFYAQFKEQELPFYAECAGYYRAAQSLDTLEDKQKFIDALPNISPKLRSSVKELLIKEPSSKLDAKNKVVKMQAMHPTETFMLSLKLAFFAGVIVAFPFILVFTLQFVLPGLKPSERKALWPALIVGFGLFLTGVFFCYFLVLPKALEFFYLYSGSMGVENEWRIGWYITFATQFTLVFGLAFELPVVVMTLVKLGLLDYDLMSRTRSYAVVSIFVIAAVITPTGDMLTLSMLAVPMSLLYEICIWFAYFSRKKELEQEAAEMASYQPRLVSAPGTEASTDAEATHDNAPEHDHDHDYFEQDPEDQKEDEGDELDDGESDSLEAFNNLRAPYDPDSDDENSDKPNNS